MAMATTTTSSPRSIASDEIACSVLNSIDLHCSSQTPNIESLPFSSAASCLCYPTPGVFDPNPYDAFGAACLGWYSTANPSAYSRFTTNYVASPCHSIGNVAHASSTITSAATYPPYFLSLEVCRSWLSTADSCTRATPDFGQLPLSEQASCFCYASADCDGTGGACSSSSWDPTAWDSARATCTDYFSTVSPDIYVSYLATSQNRVSAPCARVGDVKATAAGSGSASSHSITGAATASAQAGSSTGPTSTTSQGSAIGVGGAGRLWMVGMVALFVALQ